MTTPAVNAAALEPSPLPMGMSLWMRSSMGGMVMWTSRADRQRGLPDQVVLTRGDRGGVAAFHLDG